MGNFSNDYPSFNEMLKRSALSINRGDLKIIQINISRKCNQRCNHCHVSSSPNHTENMDQKTTDRLIQLITNAPTVEIVDITGGAPELNPHFREIVTAARATGKTIIDRTNLTVFFEPEQTDTPQFLADNQVQIFASLPCYTKENVDKQRGPGTFDKSIQALKLLNELGYGKPNTDLILNLIYNPGGAALPAPQEKLEQDYKTHLAENFGITFNHLLTITNMAIGRFRQFLKNADTLSTYEQLLIDHFNPAIVKNVMCATMSSISWYGYIYDCDFNQMLEIPLNGKQTSVWDIEHFDELSNEIIFKDHCYGCTAGAGSSCQGALK